MGAMCLYHVALMSSVLLVRVPYTRVLELSQRKIFFCFLADILEEAYFESKVLTAKKVMSLYS